MRIVIFSFAVAAVVCLLRFANQTQARVHFAEKDKYPEYVWASDFKSPEECSESLQWLAHKAPGLGADCRYAPRYRVWGLMLQNRYWQARR